MKDWAGSASAVGLAEIELTVACLCASVETLASGSCHETRAVLEIYTSLRWSFELERELDAASRWSLQRTRLGRHEKNPIDEAEDLERLVSSTSNERMTRALSSQQRRVLEATNGYRDVRAPPRLQLERVEEVPAKSTPTQGRRRELSPFRCLKTGRSRVALLCQGSSAAAAYVWPLWGCLCKAEVSYHSIDSAD
jgi:hypothetical protein